jgi:hypothetical protein
MTIQAGTGLLFLRRIAPGDSVVLGPEGRCLSVPRSFCGDLALAQTILLADSGTPTLFETLDFEMQPADPAVQLVLGASAAQEILVIDALLPLDVGYRFAPHLVRP